MRPTIVLLSGGLDSTTCLAIAKQQQFAPIYSLAFDYGQRHRHELIAASNVAKSMGVTEHRLITIDLRQFGNSALTAPIDVPKDRDESKMAASIPITYVPARNTIFLSYALAWAEVLNVRDVFIGVNSVDYSGYPDCRPEYLAAFETMANLATRIGVEAISSDHGETETNSSGRFHIHAPLIELSKSQIIRRGVSLGVDYAMTYSCYDPDERGRACGRCDSCVLRRRGFAEAGVPDPTIYIES